MIGHLEGTVKAVRKNYLILSTDYVGYKVFVTPQLSLTSEPGKKLSLYIHTHVREDQISLFGFTTLPELEFFELLLTVSGVGPKLALSVMSLSDLNMIKSGILNEDPNVFTKVSGIGRKTAERLIIELKDKITDEFGGKEEGLREISKAQADVLDVLLALGYSRSEARDALAGLPKNLGSSEEKIREALRLLAKS